MKLIKLQDVYRPFVFYFLLFALLIVEGWAMPFGRLISLHLMLFVPLVLFLTEIVKKKKLELPTNLTLLTLLFLLIVFAGTIFSVDIQLSFENRLFYVSLILMAVFIYNHQDELKKYLPFFIIAASMGTLLFAIFVRYFFPHDTAFYIVPHAYQFVAKNSIVGHDGLGAFILIPLIFLIPYIFLKPRGGMLIGATILFTALILTHLRSAYVSVVVVVALLLATLKNTIGRGLLFICLLLLLVSMTFLITVTLFEVPFPFIDNNTRRATIESQVPKQRSIQTRLDLVGQSIQSIKQNPLFGIGTYNFRYASMQFATSYGAVQSTSHNILVDIAVENGIPGGLLFIVILFIVLKKNVVLSSQSVLSKSIFAVTIAIFILFLFSHYHRMYFLLSFFVLCALLLYKEKKAFVVSTKTVIAIAGILALINIIIIFSRLSMKNGDLVRSIRLYPLYTITHEASIMASVTSNEHDIAEEKLTRYLSLYPKHPTTLAFAGNIYDQLGRNEESLQFHQKALARFPQEFSYLKNVYEADKKINGELHAKQYVSRYIDEHNLIKNNSSSWDKDYFIDWCKERDIEYTDK